MGVCSVCNVIMWLCIHCCFWNEIKSNVLSVLESVYIVQPYLCGINLLTALIIQVMHGMGTAFVLIGYYHEVTLQLIISVMKFLEWCSCSSLR